MSENIHRSETTEPLEHVSFGDIVTSDSYAPNYAHVIIGVQPSGWKDAIALVNEDQHHYGLPGTISPDHTLERVGRKSLKEITEMVARIIGRGHLTEETLAVAERHFADIDHS